MPNPDVIHYADLIAPDTSIETLIKQLEDVIKKYGELKQSIQADAKAVEQSLKGVSSATEENRKTIDQASKKTDDLTKAYEKAVKIQDESYKAVLTLQKANKDKIALDKLAIQIATSQEGSYNKLSAQYRLNTIRLNEMSEAERKGTEAGRKLVAETLKIREEMSNLKKATGDYRLEVGHYENAMKALPGALRTVTAEFGNMRENIVRIGQSDLPMGAKAMQAFGTVALGVVGIISTFVGYLANGFKAMREFEQANADLSTILGVSRDEMKALTDSALALGRTTEYTASEVTKLQTELAKLGFGQGSIIAMQKSVLEFATAVGANLGEAAEVAGATLRAFNLTSKDTEDVLGTLAVATNRSALSFSKIQTSIGTVFPVANAYGLTVKDTTALLGALANAGFDASSAATATRNILLNLADSSGKLAQRLGGSVNTFDEIIDALIKLRKGGIDVAEALELTDKRSVAAFSAFVAGAEGARELRQELEDVSGQLQTISEERLNTVEGSTKLLKSAWEGLTLAFSNSNGAMKDTIDWLTKLIGKTQQLLFPTETFIQESSEMFGKELQDVYAKYGAEAAKVYATNLLKEYQKKAKEAEKAAEQDPILNKLFRLGKNQVDSKAFANALAGVEQAVSVFIAQVDNDIDEANKRAEREAEKNAQQKDAEQKAMSKAERKRRIDSLKAVIEAIDLEIAVTEKGTERMLELRQDKINAQRQLELEQNRQKEVTAQVDARKINAKYDKLLLDDKKNFEKEKSQLRAKTLQSELDSLNLQIAVTEKDSDEMLRLRLEALEKQKQIEIEQNKQKDEKIRQNEAEIEAKYAKMMLDTRKNFEKEKSQIRVQELQAELNTINLQIPVAKKGTEALLQLRLQAIEKQRQIELEQNKQKDIKLRQDEALINAKYDAQVRDTTLDFRTDLANEEFDIRQNLAKSEFDLLNRNERQATKFRLDQEKQRLKKILELNRLNGKELTEEQRKTLQNQIEAIDKMRGSLPYNNLYEVLGIGLEPEQQEALNTLISETMNNVSEMINLWMQEAEAAIEASNKKVDAAQRTLDSEIEARDKGYANNVVQAQKNLELEKKNQQKAIEQKKKAQKVQLAIDTATQISSLVTASANIWSGMTAIQPAPLGLALAIAGLATLWGSFAGAKAMAIAQATKSEQYGTGTVELLEGGSHASGHDIDLGTTKDGKKRRAEGGEYFAVINKRNSSRFRSVIPEVINSFNDGTFADKYQKASEEMSAVAISMTGGGYVPADISTLEAGVQEIVEQGKRVHYVDGNGNSVEIYKNLTRKILK